MKGKKILIIRGGGIGDVLMCSRLPELLKEKHGKDTEIWFATQSEHFSIFQTQSDTRVIYQGDSESVDMPTIGIGRIFRDKPTPRLAPDKFCTLIRRQDFRAASGETNPTEAVLHPHVAGLLAVGAVEAIRGTFDIVFDLNGVPETSAKRYEQNRMDILAEACGVEYQKDIPAPPIMILTAEERVWAQEYLTASSYAAPYIGICMSAVSPIRCWEPEYYDRLVEMMKAEKMTAVLLNKEQKRINTSNQRVINTTGQFAIREAAAIIAECAALVTPDTGLMHVAAAQGTPTVAIFGNEKPELRAKYYPNTEGLVSPDAVCGAFPCHAGEQSTCGGKPTFRDCMKKITPGMVLNCITNKHIKKTQNCVTEFPKEKIYISTAKTNILNIEIIAPVFEPSGYASAARKIISSLHAQGVNISIKPHTFDNQRHDCGVEGKIVEKLINKNIRPDIRICIMTPNVGKQYIDSVPTGIHFYWETNKYPDDWLAYISAFDFVLSPSEWQSNITSLNCNKPVYTIGAPVNCNGVTTKEKTKKDKRFVFLSVFQWTERKNPEGLLKTYWRTFRGKTDVVLKIKTYRANTTIFEVNAIKEDVERYKKSLGFSEQEYAPVELITNLLSHDEMRKLYLESDCFILVHRGEGFGLPIVEAMAAGVPAITTNVFACKDYLDKNNSYPVDYTMIPVFGMGHIPHYHIDQMWAAPDLLQASECMVDAYSKRDALKQKGNAARKTVETKYSLEVFSTNLLSVLDKYLIGKTQCSNF